MARASEGIDRLSGQEELKRSPAADNIGQRCRPRSTSADSCLHDPEQSALGRNAKIAHLDEKESAGESDSVYGRDSRLWDSNVPPELGKEVRSWYFQAGVRHLLQVAAGAESSIPCAGEDEDLGVDVVVEPVRRGPEAGSNFGAERVTSLRAIDGDPCHWPAALVQYCLTHDMVTRPVLPTTTISSSPCPSTLVRSIPCYLEF